MPTTVSELIRFLHRFRGDQGILVQIGDELFLVSALGLVNGDGPVLFVEAEVDDDADDLDSIISQCDRILGLCDEIPEQGSDFSESVSEKVESIKAWAEDGKPVTDKQRDALENMERGARNWVDRSDGRW